MRISRLWSTYTVRLSEWSMSSGLRICYWLCSKTDCWPERPQWKDSSQSPLPSPDLHPSGTTYSCPEVDLSWCCRSESPWPLLSLDQGHWLMCYLGDLEEISENEILAVSCLFLLLLLASWNILTPVTPETTWLFANVDYWEVPIDR